MALPKKNRLRVSAEIKAVLKRGKAVSSNIAVVLYLARPKGQPSRFAFVVSGGVSKRSVVRNAIRRRAAEFVRASPQAFSSGYDTVVIFRKSAGEIKRKDFYGAFGSLLAKTPLHG